MNTKQNNKGFSLVELIVVLAIMAILAVTLAPRLSTYVEKARIGSDKETINAIYTAVRLGVLDEEIWADAETELTTTAMAAGIDLNDTVSTDSLYAVSADGDWTFDLAYADRNTLLMQEITNVVSSFTLRSNESNASTQITVTITDVDNVSVTLDYAGNGTGTTYTVSEDAIRP